MKWAIREAIDVYFKAKSTFKLGARTIRAGEPVLIFDTVKTSTLEVAAEISYVTGGKGNSRLLSYEGDKTLTFQFEEALLSNEGLAILSGADMIPARNKNLQGAHPDARSVISHYNEKYSVTSSNVSDDGNGGLQNGVGNVYEPQQAIVNGTNKVPRGCLWNVSLSRKPYVGQNASIYLMLLDDAGEMSGAPLQINLNNNIDDEMDLSGDQTTASANYKKRESYMTALSKWTPGSKFIAFDVSSRPIPKVAQPSLPDLRVITDDQWNKDRYSKAEFDDQVSYYVDYVTLNKVWTSQYSNYGNIDEYTRTCGTGYGDFWGDDTMTGQDGYYNYLLEPSGGVAQPRAYREGSTFVYKVNVPSILYQDIVLLDYYVEYQHDATQVSILPDKFGPYMYVEGSSLVRRASDGTDLPVEFVIPKFKITTALTFTLQSTGDPSTFTFQGDAYPDFSKFDLTRKVLADIQILDADDNYDQSSEDGSADPTSYRRYKYNNDTDGEYLWKDRSMVPHQNIDYSDTWDQDPASPNYLRYGVDQGGPASLTAGSGTIDQQPFTQNP